MVEEDRMDKVEQLAIIRPGDRLLLQARFAMTKDQEKKVAEEVRALGLTCIILPSKTECVGVIPKAS